MSSPLGSRGSVTVEATLSMSLLITMISGGLTLTYLCFAHVWLERASYEAVICLSTRASQAACDRKLRAEVGRALPFGQISDVNLNRRPDLASVKLQFSLGGKPLFEQRNSRALPLRLGLGLGLNYASH